AIKSEILNKAALLVGADDENDLDIQLEAFRYNPSEPSVSFTISAWKEFTGVMTLERSVAEAEENDAYIYRKGADAHGIQFPDEEPIKVIEVTISRLGVGEKTPAVPTPVETGYYFHHQSRKTSKFGPLKYGGITGVYRQSWTDTFFRLK